MSPDAEHMRRVADAHATTSDKIRALNAAGYARADIARFLGKRYQHVRNVLVDTPAPRPAPAGSAPPGMRQSPSPPYVLDDQRAVVRLPIGDDGLIKLPPVVMQALGVKPGGLVIAELESDRLVLLSVQESVRQVQEMVRRLIPGDHSLADELIAERRREAEAENG